MTDVVVMGVGVASPVLGGPGDLLGRPAPDPAFDPAVALGRGVRYKDRATQLALLAAGRALADASLLDHGGDLAVTGDSVGVVASSNLGNLDTVCRTAEVIASTSVRATSPMDLPNASSNVVASSVAVRFGLRGPNLMVCNGASSGLDAVRLGALLITAGRVSRTVVIGVEPVNEVVATLTETPAAELFDGAVAVLLESGNVTRARGAEGDARIDGYARRSDQTASVACVLGARSPGLWLSGDNGSLMPEVPRKDLEAVLGRSSGALGVLQVAAGAHWLGDGGAGPVLATAGQAGDGVAALLLASVGEDS